MEGAPDRRPTAEVQILQCTWKEAVKKSPLALLRAYTHLQKVRPSLLSSECLLRTPRIRYCSPLSPLLWSAIARTDAGPVAIKMKLQWHPWFKLESSKQAEEKAAVAEAAATEKSKKRSAAPAGETSGTPRSGRLPPATATSTPRRPPRVQALASRPRPPRQLRPALIPHPSTSSHPPPQGGEGAPPLGAAYPTDRQRWRELLPLLRLGGVRGLGISPTAVWHQRLAFGATLLYAAPPRPGARGATILRDGP